MVCVASFLRFQWACFNITIYLIGSCITTFWQKIIYRWLSTRKSVARKTPIKRMLCANLLCAVSLSTERELFSVTGVHLWWVILLISKRLHTMAFDRNWHQELLCELMWLGHTYTVHVNELVTIGSVTAATVGNWALGNKLHYDLNHNVHILD